MQEFRELFQGADHAYVWWEPLNEKEPNGKAKGKYHTWKGVPSEHRWRDHFAGKTAIGIIPVRMPNLVRWGAIDVDEYDSDCATLAHYVEKAGLPLVVDRSKSGGAHMMLFLEDWTPAERVRALLTHWRSELGAPPSLEIFPKQEILADGDKGNCLGLPYFGGDQTERYGFDASGKRLSLTEYVTFAKSRRISIEAAEAINIYPVQGLHFQRVVAPAPLPAGVVATLSNPTISKSRHDTWIAEAAELRRVGYKVEHIRMVIQARIRELYNADTEVREELEKLEGYLKTLSNRMVQQLGPLIRAQTAVERFVNWKLGCGEGRWVVVRSTKHLYNYRDLEALITQQLGIVPPASDNRTWRTNLQHLMDGVQIELADDEADDYGWFLRLLESFATDRAQGKHREDLFRGLPYLEDGYIFFRSCDLHDYLNRHRLKLSPDEIYEFLKSAGAKHGRWRVKGKQVFWHRVPAYEETNEPLEKIKIPEDPKI